ncbi:MAG: ABC transporter substrate-binding protein [Gammaproteobacteria bacterium]|nr:ABC transporter substrate-binding protein [Gammaproteobacteria bacterium]
MHGEPAMAEGFSHFRYVNPDAPRGGRLNQGAIGTFDSLNPFIVKGLPPLGIRGPLVSGSNMIAGLVVESLMARSLDEPFTLYGLIARAVTTDAVRSFITFHLDPTARFADGAPVTAADVLFSFELLRDKGRPNHRLYYGKVVRADVVGTHAVRFDLAGSDDRELPLILGLMPVLPRHAINSRTFEETSLVPLLGSGPYVVAKVDAGRSLTLTRNPNYWGRHLAVNRGLWNFNEIKIDYYREHNAFHEAFKRGLFDVRTDSDPGHWVTGYDFPAVRDGRVVKEALPSALPASSYHFVFNTRRPVFADIRVREAVAMLFDAEWLNHTLFHDLYRRTASFFEGSELSARGRAADERERTLLAPYAALLRADVMEGTWSPPISDGSGRDRTLIRRALALFAAAGYELRGTELIERKSGRPFTFEIMVTNRDEERLAIAFMGQLKRAGITIRVRMVDAVQFEARRIAFDFDMIRNRWDQSLSPGNEQSFYWSSAAADQNGSRNYMGAKNPAVDATIDALIKAHSRSAVVAAVRALDRALISGFYTIPLFHLPEQWIARWTAIERPPVTSLSGYAPETWWRKAP